MEFLETLINGLSIGGTYAMIALGYTMVYGIAKMLNFAHGDVIMVGGYTIYVVMGQFGHPLIGLAVATLFCMILGVTVEKLAYKPLRGASPLAVLITAIGVSYLLQSTAQMIFGSSSKMVTVLDLGMLTIPEVSIKYASVVTIIMAAVVIVVNMMARSHSKKLASVKKHSTWISIVAAIIVVLETLFEHRRFVMGTLDIKYSVVITLVVSFVIMLLLTLFVKYTRTGRAMIAVSEDKGAAQLMGINSNAIITLTFAIGSALAAIAGFFTLMKSPSLTNTMGAMPGIKAFTAAVIGGIGSIPGAMLGGILIGIVEAVSYSIPVIAPYTDAIEFLILIIILLVKPSGILGKKRREKV